jgi:hypothetical protein
VITSGWTGANAVEAADLDGDGLVDAVASAGIADEVRWFRNLGAGTFGPGQLIDAAADGANSVACGDLDGDGLPEVLSAARALDRVAWYRNLLGDCDANGTADHADLAAGAADCNGNEVLDACELASPAADWDGDGVLDACAPPVYCAGGVNSAGGVAGIALAGSPVLADQDLTLLADGLPPGQWSFFLLSEAQAQVPGFGASQGVLCLGPPILRLDRLALGELGQTTPQGTRSVPVDLANLPQGATFLPGSTWHFQLWFRDQNPTPTSNTSDAVRVLFR